LSSILGADLAAASFLVAFGVVLGRLTPVQYLIMVLLEVILFAVNEHLSYVVFKVKDKE
jgi:ammonium transporter Rh